MKIHVLFGIFFLCLFSSFTLSVFPTNTFLISVKVVGAKNNVGNILLKLSDLNNKLIATGQAKIQNNSALFTFSDVEAGSYSIAIFHDKNCNNKLDTNFLGIPKEGFGFSNNPKIRFSEPSLSEQLFVVTNNVEVTIKLIYF